MLIGALLIMAGVGVECIHFHMEDIVIKEVHLVEDTTTIIEDLLLVELVGIPTTQEVHLAVVMAVVLSVKGIDHGQEILEINVGEVLVLHDGEEIGVMEDEDNAIDSFIMSSTAVSTSAIPAMSRYLLISSDSVCATPSRSM